MSADARLWVIERKLPERAEQGDACDAFLVDLEMLVMTVGRPGTDRKRTPFAIRNRRLQERTHDSHCVRAVPIRSAAMAAETRRAVERRDTAAPLRRARRGTPLSVEEQGPRGPATSGIGGHTGLLRPTGPGEVCSGWRRADDRGSTTEDWKRETGCPLPEFYQICLFLPPGLPFSSSVLRRRSPVQERHLHALAYAARSRASQLVRRMQPSDWVLPVLAGSGVTSMP